jgi:glutathione peroxidase-family protein
MNDTSIYQFNVQKLDGEEINLSEYKDKVLLIVNTASQCGFTPQLKDLVELKNEFRWNFHKFLVNKAGVVTDFFYPFTKPTSGKIKKKIARLISPK